MGIIEALDANAQTTVDGLRATMRDLYAHALAHDNLPEGSMFAIFSDTNPFVQFFEPCQRMLAEAVANRAAFGYVGLVIGPQGRAVIPPPPRRSKKGKRHDRS